MIHLIAIARRIGVELELEDFDRLGRRLHCLVNLQPSGKYLMEDFYYAGGLPAVLRELGRRAAAQGRVDRQRQDHLGEQQGRALLEPRRDLRLRQAVQGEHRHRGAARQPRPDGAIIKPSAATPKLLKHRGRAVVFENIEDFHKRIDDGNLDIDESCVMVLKNCGPKGYPGMAEVGNMPLPPKVLRKGITDMVRISDARMSGTAYGTVVLHSSPEAAAGGALALVQNGDMIELDVAKRKLHFEVSDAELARRKAEWKGPPRISRAATGSSTSTTCCRRTAARTSTSWSAKAARWYRGTTTGGMAEFTLYCFAQSGNAYKAALMLNLCGADWEPRFVDFFNGETRTPEYRANSTRWARCRCSSTARSASRSPA